MVEFNTSAATIQELHAINYTLVEDYDVVTLHVVCGGLWWVVVVCGGLWWVVVGCGGL